MDNLTEHIPTILGVFGAGVSCAIYIETRIGNAKKDFVKRLDDFKKEQQFQRHQQEASARLSINRVHDRIDNIERLMATRNDINTVQLQLTEVSKDIKGVYQVLLQMKDK